MYAILAYFGHKNLNTWFLGQFKKNKNKCGPKSGFDFCGLSVKHHVGKFHIHVYIIYSQFQSIRVPLKISDCFILFNQ